MHSAVSAAAFLSACRTARSALPIHYCDSSSIGTAFPCPPGYEDPAAVLQLVEGGQLVLYHLGERQPLMVGPAFQQRTGISVADTAMVPVRRCGGRGLYGKGGELRQEQGGVWASPPGQPHRSNCERKCKGRSHLSGAIWVQALQALIRGLARARAARPS